MCPKCTAIAIARTKLHNAVYFARQAAGLDDRPTGVLRGGPTGPMGQPGCYVACRHQADGYQPTPEDAVGVIDIPWILVNCHYQRGPVL